MILSILVINAIATLIVGAAVYITGKTKRENAIWLVYNILFCLWNFGIYKALGSTGAALRLYWFKVALSGLIFTVPVFLHFLAAYSDKAVFRKKIIGSIYALAFLIFGALVFVPGEFIKGITNGVYFKYVIIPGPAFHALTLIFIGFIFTGFYYLLRSKKAYLTFKKNKRIWLFFGMLFGILAHLSFFHAIYGAAFLPFGLFCVIPYLAIVAYALIKYRVIEIGVFINKVVLLSYTTLFVISVHMLVVHAFHKIIGLGYFESSVISACIVLLNLLFMTRYAKSIKLGRATERVVYEKRLNYYKFLEEFNSMIAKSQDLNTILHYIVDSLAHMVGVECVSLYLFEEKTSKFHLKISSGINRIKARELTDIPNESPLINFLKEGNIFVMKESQDFAEDYNLEEIKKAFSEVNVRLTIPLYYSMPLYYARDIVGFLNLGNKTDGTDYTREDIDILNAIGRQIGICLDTAKLLSMSIEDDLTKLYRHSYFHKRVEEEISRCKRYTRVFSVLMIDIDNFKSINDIFGHLVGDEVLRRLAHILKTNLRKADLIARYGGEEFSILMPETDKPRGIIVAERIRARIEEEFTKPSSIKEITSNKLPGKNKLFKVRISIGVSAYRPGIDKNQLIKEADEALYKAKAGGKNRVC
jgi:diguanylate cyclase (GGDEF)-like protein